MKNLIFIITVILSFSLNTFSQTTSESISTSSDQVVKKTLYTKEERKAMRKNFLNDVDQIGLTSEVKTKYLKIVDKCVKKLNGLNKDRKLTKEQYASYSKKYIDDQNKEIKGLLTVEQYQQHEAIINRYENSILYRIDEQ